MRTVAFFRYGRCGLAHRGNLFTASMHAARRRFEKWEGLGNDFVVVDAEREDSITPAVARAICDRRFGVGADGVILVMSGPRMRVVNSDGSIPEMCGNGLRCAV